MFHKIASFSWGFVMYTVMITVWTSHKMCILYVKFFCVMLYCVCVVFVLFFLHLAVCYVFL
jgi:hypothetical protein